MSAGRDVADALVVHVAGDDPGTKGDRGDDRRLGAGVEAVDVGGRVTLGEAQTLGLGERVAVGRALLGHLRQDVVGRAVDDADDAPDRLAAEALAQRPHERDAAGDRGLEEQVDAVVVGGVEQLDADVGQQLLVGGDDRLAGGQRRGDQLACRLDAADDLDDDVDGGIGDDVVGVAGEHAGRQVDVAVTRQVADGDPGDLERDPGPGLDLLGLRGDQADERRPDVAASEDADADVLMCHGGRLRCAAELDPVSVPDHAVARQRSHSLGMSGSGMASPKLIPMSRAVSSVSQSSGTTFKRLVASASGT